MSIQASKSGFSGGGGHRLGGQNQHDELPDDPESMPSTIAATTRIQKPA